MFVFQSGGSEVPAATEWGVWKQKKKRDSKVTSLIVLRIVDRDLKRERQSAGWMQQCFRKSLRKIYKGVFHFQLASSKHQVVGWRRKATYSQLVAYRGERCHSSSILGKIC